MLLETPDGGRGLLHLKKRIHALLHAGAAACGYDDQRAFVLIGHFRCPRYLLSDNAPHASHQKGCRKLAADHGEGSDRALYAHQSVPGTRPLLVVCQLLPVSGKVKRILCLKILPEFCERFRIHESSEFQPHVRIFSTAGTLLSVGEQDGSLSFKRIFSHKPHLLLQ